MTSSDPTERPQASRAPRAGIGIMIIILVVIGLVALFGNVQRARRAQTESVTVTSTAASPTPSR